MVSRRNKEFTDEDIRRIADTYHNWRSPSPLGRVGEGPGVYEDIPGFCKAAALDEVRANNYVLLPGRYVGTEAEEEDGVPFEEKMKSLTETLAAQFARGRELEATIRENLKSIGYEF